MIEIKIWMTVETDIDVETGMGTLIGYRSVWDGDPDEELDGDFYGDKERE